MRKLERSRCFVMLIVAMLLVTMTIISSPTSQAKSVTLRFVAANHPYLDTIRPLIPEFEKKTGIKVAVENYEDVHLTPKLTVEFTSNASTVDVFMSRPLQEINLYGRNKWYEPLNKYINNKKLTPKSWDWHDFPASTRKACTYKGSVCSVPLVNEWHVLFYRKDLFEKAGLKVPKNFNELEAAAAKLHNPSAGIYGIVSRGQGNAGVTQLSSYIYNFGGDFLKNGKCVIDSPAAVKGIKFYGKLLKNYGPPGCTNMSWPQAQALFASGKVAMWTDASTLMSGIADPSKSVVSDKFGVAVFPAGPAGNHPFIAVSWALAIPSQSKNKAAAWQFVKWATSKEITKKAQLNGLTMARSSVWDDQSVIAKMNHDLVMTAKKTGPIATPYDRPLMTAVSEARDIIGEVLVKSIETGGTGNIEGMAKIAAKKIDALLAKSGENK